MPSAPAAPDWVADAWARCGLRVRSVHRHGRIRAGPHRDRIGRDHWTAYCLGGGCVELSGSNFVIAVPAGAMAIIPGLTHFRERWLDPVDADAWVIGFDILRGVASSNPFAHCDVPQAVPIAPAKELVERCTQMQECYRMPDRSPQGGDQVRARAVLDDLLWTYLDRGFANGVLTNLQQSAMPLWLASLVDHCRRRCMDPTCDVASLVTLSGYSRARVHSAFRRYIGCTPGSFLTRQRIDLACRMLQHEVHLSISEIARRCGYRNPDRFHRHFRRLVGTTPRRYRVTRVADDG